MSRFVYGRIERDDEQSWPIKIGRLEAHERCLLYRRRAGYTQAKVAEELECCRRWLNLMERGAVPCDTLLWYWEH